tara:strand:- start:1090 stop:2250 length:1161 start_codon:yes stop_codon:yes gene_type:complete
MDHQPTSKSAGISTGPGGSTQSLPRNLTRGTAIGLSVIMLSGCVTFFGPSSKDFSDHNTPWPTTAANQQSTAEARLLESKTKFEDWQGEYIRVNRSGAGLLSILGLAGAVAAGFDASKDVLKGIGFGAGGVVTFEEFLQTENGATILKNGLNALSCAEKLKDGKIGADSNKLAGARQSILSLQAGLAQSRMILTQQKSRQFTRISKSDLESQVRFEVLAGLADERLKGTATALKDAKDAVDTVAVNAWRELWDDVTGIRNEVVQQLKVDAVDLKKVYDQVKGSVDKVKDTIAKLEEVEKKVAQQGEDLVAQSLLPLNMLENAGTFDMTQTKATINSLASPGVKGASLTTQLADVSKQAADSSSDANQAATEEKDKLKAFIKQCEAG